MSHFLTGVSEDLVEECLLAMIDNNMNISLPIVQYQQVEECRLRETNREAKKAISY